MYIPRLLLLALLLPVSIVPVAAQSATDKIPASSHPQLYGRLVAPPEFRADDLPLPRLSGSVRTGIRNTPPRLSFDSTVKENDTDCYSMRSYRVTRDDPRSDSTRLAGYSECQPAARFQVKAAVDSGEQVPR
jgi:hypothetical protein